MLSKEKRDKLPQVNRHITFTNRGLSKTSIVSPNKPPKQIPYVQPSRTIIEIEHFDDTFYLRDRQAQELQKLQGNPPIFK